MYLKCSSKNYLQSFNIPLTQSKSNIPLSCIRLFNCYAATKDNCAFGVKDGDLMRELGFNKSMRAKFTVHSLFAVPQW